MHTTCYRLDVAHQVRFFTLEKKTLPYLVLGTQLWYHILFRRRPYTLAFRLPKSVYGRHSRKMRVQKVVGGRELEGRQRSSKLSRLWILLIVFDCEGTVVKLLQRWSFWYKYIYLCRKLPPKEIILNVAVVVALLHQIIDVSFVCALHDARCWSPFTYIAPHQNIIRSS